MDSSPVPFDSDAPLGDWRAIIRRNPDALHEVEMIEARWGSNTRFSGGVDYRFIRAEGKTFAGNRCLIPASEFQMTVRGKRYRAVLDSGNFFYLAGIWEPAMADHGICFRIITVYAGSDIASHQERHGAVLHRRQVMDWLDANVPECDLLVAQPARTFRVDEIGKAPSQGALAL